MQLHYRQLLLFIGLFSGYGCHPAATQKAAVADAPVAVSATGTLAQNNAADSCERLVYRLVASTGLYHTITTTGDSLHMHVAADSLNFFIDNTTDSGITVKLSHDNEAEPGAFVDAVDAWIYIDLHKELVTDITIDPDTPVVLSFNEALLQKVKHCRPENY